MGIGVRILGYFVCTSVGFFLFAVLLGWLWDFFEKTVSMDMMGGSEWVVDLGFLFFPFVFALDSVSILGSALVTYVE